MHSSRTLFHSDKIFKQRHSSKLRHGTNSKKKKNKSGEMIHKRGENGISKFLETAQISLSDSEDCMSSEIMNNRHMPLTQNEYVSKKTDDKKSNDSLSYSQILSDEYGSESESCDSVIEKETGEESDSNGDDPLSDRLGGDESYNTESNSESEDKDYVCPNNAKNFLGEEIDEDNDNNDQEGEAELNASQDNVCGFSNAFLRRLEVSQTEILRKRAEMRNPRVIQKARKCRSSRGGLRRTRVTMVEAWEEYLERIERQFFNSSEARLEEGTKTTKGKPAYQGLLINAQNNPDMKRIYEVSWKSKEDLGQSMGTYDQFRVVLGQYARFAVAAGMCKPIQLVRQGMIFNILCSLPAVQAFIRYFEIRSAAGTVMNKALHLIRLGKYAETYFSANDCSVQVGQVMGVVEYLRGVAKVFKSESRRQAFQRKDEDNRIESGRYLHESDMITYGNGAVDVLNDLIFSATKVFREKGATGVEELFLRNKDVLRKWNLNFISALMLHGGGQRPQVYTILEPPSPTDFLGMDEEVRESGVFSLDVSFEKRQRCSELPKVLFPKVLYRPLKLHVNHILPALYKKHEVAEEDARRKCLLLHTETGNILESKQVTASIRAFLKAFDPELSKISSMTLRASYSTMMMRRYRRGETLGNLNTTAFIDYLSKLMNTSAEQLHRTYMATDGETFKACAQMVSGLLDNNRRDDSAKDSTELF